MISSIQKVSTLLFGVAILVTGHGMQLALVPIRADLMGWSSVSVGALGSIYFSGFLAGCFVVPVLVGRIGHIRTFAALTALMAAIVLSLALFSDFYFWLVLRFFTGLAISGLYLVIESWLNEQTEDSARGGVIATYTAIVLGALALGQLLLNSFPIDDNRLIIFAALLVCLAAIPVCVTRTIPPAQIPTAIFSPLLVLKTSKAAVIGALISGLVGGTFYSLGPLYGLKIGMDISSISIMMALGIAGGALSQLPLGRLSDKKDRRLVILFVMLAGTVSTGLAWAAPVNYIPYAMMLFGACVMPIYALSLAHASDNIKTESFLEVGTGLLMTNAIGSIIGPLLTSKAMQLFGAEYFFSINAVILLIGSISIAILIQLRTPNREHFTEFEFATTASAQGMIQMDPRSESS
ncbi:MAG: MFS family permease [Pseudohongiellaceae bacterium]|jgi:MFS family permease